MLLILLLRETPRNLWLEQKVPKPIIQLSVSAAEDLEGYRPVPIEHDHILALHAVAPSPQSPGRRLEEDVYAKANDQDIFIINLPRQTERRNSHPATAGDNNNMNSAENVQDSNPAVPLSSPSHSLDRTQTVMCQHLLSTRMIARPPEDLYLQFQRWTVRRLRVGNVTVVV